MTMGSGDYISVVIVNYGTSDLALAALESVLSRQHGGRRMDVHIVDNASPDGDGRRMLRVIGERGWADRVTLHLESENHGFGRGNNLVLTKLAALPKPPRYVFLLNPDAYLKNEAISKLADFLDGHPEAAVAGCRVESVDGVPLTAAFRFPNAVGVFSSALGFGPVARLLRRWEVPLPPVMSTRAVDWVVGAAVMMRLDAVRAAGFFDPGYFLYYEEVDLMRQIRLAGGQVWHVAEGEVVHVEGAATKVAVGRTMRPRLPGYWYDSWRHYFLKNHGRPGAIVAAAAWCLGVAGNRSIAVVRRRPSGAPEYFYRDIWARVLRPLLGLGGVAGSKERIG